MSRWRWRRRFYGRFAEGEFDVGRGLAEIGRVLKATQLFLDLFRVKPAVLPTGRGVRMDAELTAQSAEMLDAAGAGALGKKVRVVWNSRLTTTAGQARFRQHLVVLNPRLQEFGVEEIDRTLRHELAHLLAHARAGRLRIPPHGEEWQVACRDLGLVDEKRTHNLPFPRREVARRHVYACVSCGEKVHRVRPFRRRVACLACCRKHNRGQYAERFLLRKV